LLQVAQCDALVADGAGTLENLRWGGGLGHQAISSEAARPASVTIHLHTHPWREWGRVGGRRIMPRLMRPAIVLCLTMWTTSRSLSFASPRPLPVNVAPRRIANRTWCMVAVRG